MNVELINELVKDFWNIYSGVSRASEWCF